MGYKLHDKVLSLCMFYITTTNSTMALATSRSRCYCSCRRATTTPGFAAWTRRWGWAPTHFKVGRCHLIMNYACICACPLFFSMSFCPIVHYPKSKRYTSFDPKNVSQVVHTVCTYHVISSDSLIRSEGVV